MAPHRLFDAACYRDRYGSVYGRAFDPDADGNPYAQFLRVGQHQRLSGHWLFDPSVYAALAPCDVTARITGDGPFTTFLCHLQAGGAEPVVSNLFDPDWYLAHYPSVAEAIARGEWVSALQPGQSHLNHGRFRKPRLRYDESCV